MWYRKISPKFWQWLCLLTLLNAPFHQARAADQVSLQLRWDHQFQFAGYYAAAWQGFYAANGLDVEIRGALTPSGILSATQEVREGRADFGVGAADILIADDQGAALSVVAVIFQQSAAAFYLKAETPFAALADLTRLRVARRVNDLIDVELQAMLRSEGLDPATITPYPHQAGIKHLLSDQVQVMPGYRTSIPFLMAQHGLKLREIRPIQYGIDFYGDSLFCQMELTRTRPEMVARFVQASRQGWAYALEHPAEIADQITARFVRRDTFPGVQIAEFNRFQADVVRQLTLYPLIELGHVNPYRWERMHHLLAQAGLVKQALNLTTFVFNEQKFHDDESQRQQRLLVEIAVGLLVALATAVIFLVSLRRLVTVRTGTLRAEITDRKLAEEALHENEERLQLAMKATNDVVWDWDILHDSQRWNEAGILVFGWADIVTQPQTSAWWGERIHLADRQRVVAKFDAVVADPAQSHWQDEYHFRKADGSYALVFDRGYVIRNEQGAAVRMIGAMLDITERKRAEEQLKVHNRLLEEAVQQKQHEMEALFDTLRRQEKLATIGQMAGSIAHELRNPLGAVKQSVFYLKRLVETQELTASNPKVLRHLDLMDAELNTSARVISDLLEMTRQKPLHCQVTDLRALISEAVTRGQLPERVRVTIALESEPFLIYADPLQMHQVFLNLLTNAAQAIKGEGAITIRAKQLTEHGESLIEIYDSGVGIAPEALPKIFEPLYTTKATGTGLGLSICKQIIENHQGRISLTSQPGQGVTVTLRLPKEQQP